MIGVKSEFNEGLLCACFFSWGLVVNEAASEYTEEASKKTQKSLFGDPKVNGGDF